jgi:hypothetical protein
LWYHPTSSLFVSLFVLYNTVVSHLSYILHFTRNPDFYIFTNKCGFTNTNSPTTPPIDVPQIPSTSAHPPQHSIIFKYTQLQECSSRSSLQYRWLCCLSLSHTLHLIHL